MVCSKAGQTFGTHQARWDFVSTVQSGGSVGQAVVTQSSGKLAVTLTYIAGTSTVLTVVATCEATVAATLGVSIGTASVTDTFSP